ncbi:DUF5354 domain-containing protein [Caenorhabditis elegans]|uniref:Secreted protein n=2 Tax=Caenorhabditis elegans TaxID=6239 RepID=H2KZE6_CAEEL|nr:Secreted protein [Caenorhabditis elegans]CCD67904.1 Secreted protein [Caenorhabditis elegans]|eukprot:NP_001024645.1 Uncharacterized protein CELE_F41B4.2 [Caenorhabditis elegans]
MVARMIAFSKLAGVMSVIALANSLAPAENAVQDAKNQEDKLLRCWEKVDVNNPGSGYVLSEPIFTLCSHMIDPKDNSKFHVNGVDENSDDYSPVLKMFADTIDDYAVLTVCLQEAFAFHGPTRNAQISLRCLCKREGCNAPRSLTEFLEFNKKPMPAFSH